MPRKASNKQSFLHGAVILAAATALIKVIGAIFKIPLVNILGAEGFSNFIISYGVYNFFITVSTTGLPVALAKMISEANALERENQVRRIFRVTFQAFLCVGLFGTLVMAVFCKPLSVLLGDELAWTSVLALAPALLFVCVMSAFRGYFQGLSNMKPTAVSQIIEALGKLVFGLSLAYIIVKNSNSVFLGSAGSIVGVTLGTVLGALYLFTSKLRDRATRSPGNDTPDSQREILKKLLALAVPITLGSSILSLLTMADNAIVLHRLRSALGYTASLARTLNGSYGSAQTVYNFPIAFITPLAVSIIPHISENLALKRVKQAAGLTESAMRITALIAQPASAGLCILSGPVLRLLYYSRPDVYSTAEPLLRLLAPVVFFNSFVLLTNAILQSNGYVKIPLYSMLIGGVIKIVVNWFLVAIPSLNIAGAPIGSICCFAFIVVFNVAAIFRLFPEKLSLARMFLRPLVSTAVMSAAVWAVYSLLERTFSDRSGFIYTAIATLAAVAVGVAVYAVLIIVTKALRKEDLALLPKGEKIALYLKLK
ncbi:MAG: polysaccharide biosynthesis protein [Clostridiales bacterium]|nr:polysaccharide biosynthesis protein [Clostridiales bacterium]